MEVNQRIVNLTCDVNLAQEKIDRLTATNAELLAALQQIADHQEMVTGSMYHLSATWNIASKAIRKAGQ